MGIGYSSHVDSLETAISASDNLKRVDSTILENNIIQTIDKIFINNIEHGVARILLNERAYIAAVSVIYSIMNKPDFDSIIDKVCLIIVGKINEDFQRLSLDDMIEFYEVMQIYPLPDLYQNQINTVIGNGSATSPYPLLEDKE